MSLIIRQALWSNPWGRFFRFGEKYNAVSFTSNPVFLTCIALSYNRTECPVHTKRQTGGKEKCCVCLVS